MATMPTFAGATRWINSPPLGPSLLAGHVVLVNFWTLTCINWLRTAPYIRAWSEGYLVDGLVVVGVHTPECSFEYDVDLVKLATRTRHLRHAVAMDNVYAVWNAFDNHYWPAETPGPPSSSAAILSVASVRPSAASGRIPMVGSNQ